LSGNTQVDLDQVLALPAAQRVAGLVAVGRQALANGGANGDLLSAILSAVESGEGSRGERMELGEVLGLLGDPRVLTSKDPAYWVSFSSPDHDFQIGRYPVTNAEYHEFVDAGGYEDSSYWSSEGWEWLQGCENPWPDLAKDERAGPFVVPNQPVVGVSFYEAEAFAKWAGVRLPRRYERVFTVRGPEKRPYPWGEPFGEGNANTKEEVLGRPCAIGLYRQDQTPEGVFDLAGNVAEWILDSADTEQMIHPGAWDRASLASWAKALTTERRAARGTGLGFRLARDV